MNTHFKVFFSYSFLSLFPLVFLLGLAFVLLVSGCVKEVEIVGEVYHEIDGNRGQDENDGETNISGYTITSGNFRSTFSSSRFRISANIGDENTPVVLVVSHPAFITKEVTIRSFEESGSRYVPSSVEGGLDPSDLNIPLEATNQN